MYPWVKPNSSAWQARSTTRDAGGSASPTRAIIAGGQAPSYSNHIEYITIATTGNSSDFGDLTAARLGCHGSSNAVRGVFFGGYSDPPGAYNTIDYITLATLGNATDFGDMTHTGGTNCATSNSTRATEWNDAEISYVEILTTGNAVDFGDLITARKGGGACSNGHGGL